MPGRTADALEFYEKQGGIVRVERREDARNALLARYAHDLRHEPKGSQLILAYTRDDVGELNTVVRALRAQNKQLGKSEEISTERGKKDFSVNDRIRFLKNERDLGVKNGSLGTIERIERGVLQMKLDGEAGSRVTVDTKFYKHVDHGYAATVHKAQGTTVDRTYVLATPHFDRHTSYVALSRHREAATVFYASDDFGGRAGRSDTEVKQQFIAALSRARPKELAHYYLERDEVALLSSLVVQKWQQSRAAEKSPTAIQGDSPQDTLADRQQAAAERWAARRHNALQPTSENYRKLNHDYSLHPDEENTRERNRDGPEEDLTP